MLSLPLDGRWEVRPEGLDCIGERGCADVAAKVEGWLPAEVPGEVHLDLIRAGQMPEPSVGTNAPQCRWPETKSWWYRTSFEADAELLASERQQLVFEGLDLYTQVFLNGRLVGEAANAFVPAVLDAKPFLAKGRNELVLRLTAGSELAEDDTPPGQGQPERRPSAAADGSIPNPAREGDPYGHRMWAGRKWLRKPQFSYGWDWVDALPNIGIWRGVRLEGHSHAVLDDLRLDTVVHGSQVYLELEAIVENLHPWSDRQCALSLEVRGPDGGAVLTRRYELGAQPGRTPVRDLLEVPDPQLWWPNGMGAQPLYTVQARLAAGDGQVCDERGMRIGLRTIELDRSPLSEGSRFVFRVNGQEVFCRGGNIGPQDMILARVSDVKYEALVAEARNAHMNMIRINGCSVFERPAFYEACDRMGIMVWHDFMLTCTTYPEERAAFTTAVCAEVEAAVRMLRHHPSIALWCGNNECTWGFAEGWNPDRTQPLELGGEGLYNRHFPDICRRVDPHRPYWPGSPCGGDSPGDELAGDCHWWQPFFMSPEMQRRIRHETFDECRARFVSEYGVIGPCHPDSIEEYLALEDRRPGSSAWRVHTNSFEQATVPAAIRFHYADPETLSVPEYVAYGQMFQALIHGHAMEALRFRKQDPVDDCQGALIWSYSDCWGETGWSILDYYLRRKASYYWFRRACAPLKVIVRRRGPCHAERSEASQPLGRRDRQRPFAAAQGDTTGGREDRLVTRVVNDTLTAASVHVDVGWWRLDGSAREVDTYPVEVAANAMTEVTSAPLDPAAHDPRHWLYAAVLRTADGRAADQSLWLLAPHRELGLAPPDIRVESAGGEWLKVSSPVYCHAVHVEDHGRELLSDNWFDLLPAVPVPVRRCSGSPNTPLRFEALAVPCHTERSEASQLLHGRRTTETLR